MVTKLKNCPECRLIRCECPKGFGKPIAPEESACNYASGYTYTKCVVYGCKGKMDKGCFCKKHQLPIEQKLSSNVSQLSSCCQHECCKCFCDECKKNCWHSKCKVHIEPVKSTWEEEFEKHMQDYMCKKYGVYNYDFMEAMIYSKDFISSLLQAERKEIAKRIEVILKDY
jgi:hypothetical protein